MNVPRELRDLVYSKAAKFSGELFKRLLCASQQINEKARPVDSKNEERMELQQFKICEGYKQRTIRRRGERFRLEFERTSHITQTSCGKILNYNSTHSRNLN